MSFLALDHIQISIPAGQLAAALQFYVSTLGMVRIAKPPTLSQTGAWLLAGPVSVHLGETSKSNGDEEENLSLPPKQGEAHPAFRVDNFAQLFQIATQKGLKTRVDSGPSGYCRGSIWDPFGNRIELMQAL